MRTKKVSTLEIKEAKGKGRKLTLATGYDALLGQLIDLAEIDMLLVGDSLGMVFQGQDGTVPVTMDEMVYHIRAVARGCRTACIVGDMPFMSYNVSIPEAVANAGRLMKEGGCDAVKLEGGQHFAPTVEAIVKAGIPVQGHVGLTPQTAGALGGFKVQGKDLDGVHVLLADVRALEAAGCFSIVVEAVPAEVGRLLSEAVAIPIISVGAGPFVDGQGIVTPDMLGLFERTPKFVKRYAQLRETIVAALVSYREEVAAGSFPGPEHCYKLPDEAAAALAKAFKS